jgi:hypothetical protein
MRSTSRLVVACVVVWVAGPSSAYAAPDAHRWERPGSSSPGSAAAAGASRLWKPLPALVPSAADGLTASLARGEIDDATYALERAMALFHPAAVRGRYGQVTAAGPRDATMILRDLAVRLRDLSPAERDRAEAILARPTDGAADPEGDGYTVPSLATCSTNLCFHWVPTTPDAPPGGDATGNGVPDWVDQTADVFEAVWATEVGVLGYRAPKSDLTSTNHGTDGRVDVYLANLGDDGLFGYCQTDDPNVELVGTPAYPFYDVSAYCVVDNDFVEFAPLTSADALQVTAAHEFFHAIQFGYDFLEDLTLLEGSAVWMEDQVYDEINDAYNYFPSSPLRAPEVPLDYAAEGFQYGSWIFWRFLTEYFGSTNAADPGVIHRIWELADGSAVGPDQYSMQAAHSVAVEHGSSLRFAFADFGAVNAAPGSFYEEGGSYPSPPLAKAFMLTKKKPATAVLQSVLHHLTNLYVSFRPGAGITPGARIQVTLDLPANAHRPEATLVVFHKTGRVQLLPVTLSNKGVGSRTVTFSQTKIIKVVLVLTNASARYHCWEGTVLACQGLPLDDDQVYEFTAGAIL